MVRGSLNLKVVSKPQSQNSKIYSVISSLNVGDAAEFPIEKIDSVRTLTSKCNAINGGQRCTKMNRINRTITVYRKA